MLFDRHPWSWPNANGNPPQSPSQFSGHHRIIVGRLSYQKIGYRNGLIPGKEASAQEGFHIGFKESVLGGYKWGIVRDVKSVLACLPHGKKEKLVETQEKGSKLQSLHEAMHSLSVADTLKLFNDNTLTDKTTEQKAESGSNVASLQDQS